MTVNLEIPRKQQLEHAAHIAGAAVCGLIIARIIGTVADKVHEKKQDREIKKLKKQLSEQDERIDELEAQLDALTAKAK